MNFDKIKQEISIVSYLKSIGYKPYFENDYTARFTAEFRSDKNPSLSICKSSNLFFDHGTGIGGNIIQLVATVNSCTDYEASKILMERKDSFSFHCKPILGDTAKSLRVISTLPISNKYLIQYLHSRKIPIALANQYCKEVYYENGEKQYYAIGFPNNSGGYELRSKYLKGCTNKDITILKYANPQNQCLLFEGFFDLLSYLTLGNGKLINQDVLVLNSLSNINKAIPILKNYDLINGYLDNDESGKSAVNKLVSDGMNVLDKSYKYAPHKDLNEYLIHHSTTEKR